MPFKFKWLAKLNVRAASKNLTIAGSFYSLLLTATPLALTPIPLAPL